MSICLLVCLLAPFKGWILSRSPKVLCASSYAFIWHASLYVLHSEITPEKVVVYPGGNARFTCEAQCPHLYWRVIPELDYNEDPINGLQHKMNISDVQNNTRVLCCCYSELIGESSIEVQGICIQYFIHFSVQCVLYSPTVHDIY